MPDLCSKDNTKTVKRPVRKKCKGNTDAKSRGKKNARWISRCARNKPKQNPDQKPIVLSEDSESEVEHFLVKEYLYS
jgi:hypothetical protein